MITNLANTNSREAFVAVGGSDPSPEIAELQFDNAKRPSNLLYPQALTGLRSAIAKPDTALELGTPGPSVFNPRYYQPALSSTGGSVALPIVGRSNDSEVRDRHTMKLVRDRQDQALQSPTEKLGIKTQSPVIARKGNGPVNNRPQHDYITFSDEVIMGNKYAPGTERLPSNRIAPKHISKSGVRFMDKVGQQLTPGKTRMIVRLEQTTRVKTAPPAQLLSPYVNKTKDIYYGDEPDTEFLIRKPGESVRQAEERMQGEVNKWKTIRKYGDNWKNWDKTPKKQRMLDVFVPEPETIPSIITAGLFSDPFTNTEVNLPRSSFKTLAQQPVEPVWRTQIARKLTAQTRVKSFLKFTERFVLFNTGILSARSLWDALHERLPTAVYQGIRKVARVTARNGTDNFHIWIAAEVAAGLKQNLQLDYKSRCFNKAKMQKLFKKKTGDFRSSWRLDVFREPRDLLPKIPHVDEHNIVRSNVGVTQNINGFHKKIAAVDLIVKYHKNPAFIALQETRSYENRYDCALNGYKSYTQRAGPGLFGQCLLVRKDLPSWLVSKDTVQGLIHVAINGIQEGIVWHIFAVYLPSGNSNTSVRRRHVKKICSMVDSLKKADPKAAVALTGDWNTQTSELSKQFTRYSRGMLSVTSVTGSDISRVCFIRHKLKRSALDHFVVCRNAAPNVMKTKVNRHIKASDHYAVSMTLQKNLAAKQAPLSKEIYSFKDIKGKADELAYHNKFAMLSLETIKTDKDLDVAYEQWNKAVAESTRALGIRTLIPEGNKKHFCRKTQRILQNEAKAKLAWEKLDWNSASVKKIQRITLRVQNAQTASKKARAEYMITRLRKDASETAKMLRNHEQKTFHKRIDAMVNRNQGSSNLVPVRDNKGQLQTSPQAIVDTHFEHYKSLAKDTTGLSQDSTHWAKVPYTTEAALEGFHLSNESLGQDLLKAIRRSATGTSPGTNGHPIELFKALMQSESDRVVRLNLQDKEPVAQKNVFPNDKINWSNLLVESVEVSKRMRSLPETSHIAIKESSLPLHMGTPMGIAFERLIDGHLRVGNHIAEGLADGRITSLVKDLTGDQTSMNNRRGITVSNEEIKLLFSTFAHKISARLESSSWFRQEQGGFRSKLESIGQFITVFEAVRRRHIAGKTTSVVFMDFMKAFDKVMHEGMWLKLASLGLADPEISLIKALYREGKSRVSMEGYMSDWFKLERGTRQGDPLSPLLFIIFVNDLLKDVDTGVDVVGLKKNVKGSMYADDLAGLVVESPEQIQRFLDKVGAWCLRWGLPIGAIKCKVMLLGCTNLKGETDEARLEAFHKNTFTCCDQQILTATSYKYLGVTIKENFAYKYEGEKDFVATLKSKVKKTTLIYGSVLADKHIPLEVKRQVLLSRIIPVGLGYGAEWFGLTTEVHTLQRSVTDAIKLAFGSRMTSNVYSENMSAWELNLPTVEIGAALARQRLWLKSKDMNTTLGLMAKGPTSSPTKNWFSYYSMRVMGMQTNMLKTAQQQGHSGLKHAFLPNWAAIALRQKYKGELPNCLVKGITEAKSATCPDGWDAMHNPQHLEILLLNKIYTSPKSERDQSYDNHFFGKTRDFLKQALFVPELAEGVRSLSRARLGAYLKVNNVIAAPQAFPDQNPNLKRDHCPMCQQNLKKDSVSYWEVQHWLFDCDKLRDAFDKHIGHDSYNFVQEFPDDLTHSQTKEYTTILLLGGLPSIKGIWKINPKYQNTLEILDKDNTIPKLKNYIDSWGHIKNKFPDDGKHQGFAIAAKFLEIALKTYYAALFGSGKGGDRLKDGSLE